MGTMAVPTDAPTADPTACAMALAAACAPSLGQGCHGLLKLLFDLRLAGMAVVHDGVRDDQVIIITDIYVQVEAGVISIVEIAFRRCRGYISIAQKDSEADSGFGWFSGILLLSGSRFTQWTSWLVL